MRLFFRSFFISLSIYIMHQCICTYLFTYLLCRYDSVFSAIRDCYEAYAVYTFIALLIAIMEDGQGLPELLSKVLCGIIITVIKLCMYVLLLHCFMHMS